MELTRQDVLKLAELARLSLTDEEIVTYQADLGEILAHVERLQGYMTDQEVVTEQNVRIDATELRSDAVTPALDATAREQFIDQTRTNESGSAVVPTVFGDRS